MRPEVTFYLDGRLRVVAVRAATSCIPTPCQVDAAHMVTVEGLREGDDGTFTEATFREAGRRARREIELISDVRGSRDSHPILAEDVLLRFSREARDGGRGLDP